MGLRNQIAIFSLLILSKSVFAFVAGSVDSGFNAVDIGFGYGAETNNTVRAILVQPDGKILVGGHFTTYNNIPSAHIVRLNTDGSMDSSFRVGLGAGDGTGVPDITTRIYSISLQADNKILIVGKFATFNGIVRNNIARLNTDGSLDTSFDTGSGSNGDIDSLVVKNDGKIIIGGNFTSFNGVSVNRILRLDQNGSIDATFNSGAGFDGYVDTIVIRQDGKILVGGDFTHYNNVTRNYFACLSEDGLLDDFCNSGIGFNARVRWITLLPDGKILLAGSFTSFNGEIRQRIIKLNESFNIDYSFESNISVDDSIYVLAIDKNETILVGGMFKNYGGSNKKYLVRLHSDGTLDQTFNVNEGPDYYVYTIFLQEDEKILIGGVFSSYDTYAQKFIGRIHASGNLDEDFNPGSGVDGSINKIIIKDDNILIAGDFTRYNGQFYRRISRLSRDGDLDYQFDPGAGADSQISETIIQSDGKILISGCFNNFDGVSRQAIARLNSDGTLDFSFTSGLAGPLSSSACVGAMEIQGDGKILIGGRFLTYDGVSVNRLVRLNTNGSLDQTFPQGIGPGGAESTNTIEEIHILKNGKILVTGGFSTFNGVTRNRMALLNPNGSLDVSFDPQLGPNGSILTMAEQPDGKIILGGAFTSFNGVTRNRIARINSDGSLDTAFDIGSGAIWYVNALVIQPDNKVIVGGSFSNFNGSSKGYIVRLNTDGSLDNSFDVGANYNVYSIALQLDGRVIIGGSFTAIKQVGRNGLARLNPDGSLDIGVGVKGIVYTMSTTQDKKIIIGGSFTEVNGVSRNGVAKIDRFGSLDFSFDPRQGTNGTVYTSQIQGDGKLYIAGDFTKYDNTLCGRLVRLNSNGSFDNSFNSGSGANDIIYASILQADHKLIIVGAFTAYNGISRNRIARINQDGSLDDTFNPGLGADRSIYMIALQSTGKFIVGGEFTMFDDAPRFRLARVNPNGSLDNSFHVGGTINDAVKAIAVQDDDRIVIGGEFTSVNNNSKNHMARLLSNGDLDGAFGSSQGANDSIEKIVLENDGKIYVAGKFDLVDGNSRGRIARLNQSGNVDAEFTTGSGADNSITAISIYSETKILIGGAFSSYDGINRDGVAILFSQNDLDEDGVFDSLDNCKFIVNSDQLNNDNDAFGNICDAFPDDPFEAEDTDEDGIGNNADWDDDGDGVIDTIDASPLNRNDASEIILPMNGIYKGSVFSESQETQ